MIIFLMHLMTALIGVAVTVVLVCKLTIFSEQFNLTERIGMGLIGGTMILRIGPVMLSPETTPFSDWSGLVMCVGLFMAHSGRLLRLFRHLRNNTLAVDSASKHLRARGKL